MMTPVRVPEDSVVIDAGTNERGIQWLELRGASGYWYFTGLQDRPPIEAFTWMRRGDPIGYPTPHVHFRLGQERISKQEH
jgi:hypothetical protein